MKEYVSFSANKRKYDWKNYFQHNGDSLLTVHLFVI